LKEVEEGNAYITDDKALVQLRVVLQDILVARNLQKKSKQHRLLSTSIKPLKLDG
jgi:hypothetical protein